MLQSSVNRIVNAENLERCVCVCVYVSQGAEMHSAVPGALRACPAC